MKQHVAPKNARGNADPGSERAGHAEEGGGQGALALVGSEQELVQLNHKLGELETSLEQALRRIERLIGERNQLRTLLDKRDEQIQHLNRHLGARRFPVEDDPAEAPQPSSFRELLPALARKLLAKGRAATSRLAEQSSAPASEERPNQTETQVFNRPPLVVDYKKAEPRAVLAVVLIGLDDSEILNLLPVIERDCLKSDMMPLVLTDNDAFELLRERKMVFEYLPPADDRQRFSRQLSWDLYLQRRLSIIRRKWQPSRVIAMGEVAADMLQLWQDSPFEEIPLPTALNT